MVFTKFPKNPNNKDNKIKIQSKEEINKILRSIFKINYNDNNIPEIKTYFIDTEIDENENSFSEKYQDTIDIMLEQIVFDVDKNKSINTENLDISGDNAKKRSEEEIKEIERLKKLIEEERILKDKRAQEKKRLQEEFEKEKRKKEEIERKEREYRELLRKQEEERRKYEEENRRLEEERRRLENEQRRREEEFRRIEDEKRRYIQQQEEERSICFIF